MTGTTTIHGFYVMSPLAYHPHMINNYTIPNKTEEVSFEAL